MRNSFKEERFGDSVHILLGGLGQYQQCAPILLVTSFFQTCRRPLVW